MKTRKNVFSKSKSAKDLLKSLRDRDSERNKRKLDWKKLRKILSSKHNLSANVNRLSNAKQLNTTLICVKFAKCLSLRKSREKN